jgi:pilus assembly protein FimV
MMKRNLLDDRAGLADKVLRTPPLWPLRMATVATVIALGAYSPAGVHALGLGRITVLSALGEPLSAEIDIPQITPEEAASLKAGVSVPAAFRAAGVEYNPILSGAQITLQQRPDGRAFLRVTSDKVVGEPFVDLILEANWSTGKLVRDYTLLFDPPRARRPVPAEQVTAAQVTTQNAASAPPPATNTQRSAAPAKPEPPAKPARTNTPRATPQAAAADAKQLKVQTGDTAGRIAAANKPAELSLDQMLVAMLRINPDAFIGGNINRIKAGALLSIPSAEQASSLTASEARKTLSVQSANFNEFRRKLASAVPATQVAAADRKASGNLQTRVEDKKPAATAPDKLTLTKGTVKDKVPEAQIAASRQTKETTERVAELSKNIKDISRLQDKATAAGAGAPASAASSARGLSLPVATPVSAVKASAPAPAVTASAVAPATPASAKVSAPVATATIAASPVTPAASSSTPAASAAISTASAPSTAASSPAAMAATQPASSASAVTQTVASASTATTSQPIVPASKPALPPAPANVEEPSFLSDLFGNPVVPIVGGGLLALLAGFGFYRARQRKNSTQVDSSFLESRLQPDSFFGSSGGQRVDTSDATDSVAPGSSLVYSPSQLDAAGDVDPVAEADVYLAYGRDLQAEEILKEALRVNPSRIAIHGKLLEIYAKRRDIRAFEVVAGDAHKLTGGEGSEWDRICELGRELDSENALYQPGGTPKGKVAPAPLPEPDPMHAAFGASTIPVSPQPEFSPSSMSIDLDLGDLDLMAASPAAPEPVFDASRTIAVTPRPAAAPPAAAPVAAADSHSLAWDPQESPTHASSASTEADDPFFDIITADIPAAPTPPAPVAAKPVLPVTQAKDPIDSGMIEFDLGSLAMDLEPAASHADASSGLQETGGADDDPLATKLELAQEFHAIGDTDGARALVEEVVAASTGPLKAKAQRFLAELG